VALVGLRRREPVAEGTFAFYFEKPAGFTHEAGQNAMFTLLDPAEEDASGPTRPFTLASAPHEPELMIATRMRDSAFKRYLAKAPLGTKVEMDGPAGVMVLHEDARRPAVFLAGGIGITPFVAIARDAAKRRLPHLLTLFYSNRRPKDAAFLAELERMPNLRLISTMTDAPDWAGERRRIGPELLAEHVKDLRSPVYYFAGPPGMTMAVQGMLAGLGVAEADMRSEEFYGY
jgi:ferredoxin-NADP reductase